MDFSPSKKAKQNSKTTIINGEIVDVRKVCRIGPDSHGITLPAQWLKWFCEPDESGHYWVGVRVEHDGIMIRPIKDHSDDFNSTD